MRHIDRLRLTALELGYVADNWFAFKANLADRTADGYPTGSDSPGGGGVADPTPAAVAARTRTAGVWQEVDALTIEAHGIARRLAILIGPYIAPYDPRHDLPARCSGGLAHDGADVWGDPTCGAHAVTRDGLCDRCRQRRDHWRRGGVT